MKKNLIIVGVIVALVAIAYFKQTGSSTVVSVSYTHLRAHET